MYESLLAGGEIPSTFDMPSKFKPDNVNKTAR